MYMFDIKILLYDVIYFFLEKTFSLKIILLLYNYNLAVPDPDFTERRQILAYLKDKLTFKKVLQIGMLLT